MDFKDPDSLNKAYELNGTDLGGYSLYVDEAKPRPDNNRDGGFSGGRGSRGGRSDRGRGGGRGRGLEAEVAGVGLSDRPLEQLVQVKQLLGLRIVLPN